MEQLTLLIKIKALESFLNRRVGDSLVIPLTLASSTNPYTSVNTLSSWLKSKTMKCSRLN